MSYSNGLLHSSSSRKTPQRGLPCVGFKLSDDGNYDIDGKRLTNVADSTDDNDAVNLKVLKEHTQFHQNNYHLQPTFKIYKEFGDNTQLTAGSPPSWKAGVDDGIKFQIRYFGSQYNKNIKFLFYSRVIKGTQSTGFNHNIFNVSDVDDNHEILYFENFNLNSNLISGLGDPADDSDAVSKKYVHTENAMQNIAIADKASKSYVDGEIAKVNIDTTPLLPRDGSRSMFGYLDMGRNHILSLENLTDYKADDPYDYRVRDLRSAVNKEYLNERFLKKDKNGNYFDLRQNIVGNCESYYDGLFSDNDFVSKAFVDNEIAKLPKPNTAVLKLDESEAMTGNLNMGGFAIKNIKPFVEDDSSQAAFDAQKNHVINFGYFHTERGELKRFLKIAWRMML